MIFRVLRLKEIKCANVLYLNPGEGIREVVNRIPDKQMNPEKRLIRQEAKQLLEKAIDDLPEKYRIKYILKEIEGLDNAQVAATLDLSDSNIKVRLHRAKKLLNDSLLELSAHEPVFEFGNSHCDAVIYLVMKHI